MRRVDTVIVGAGILGCVIARELLGHAPQASIAVIDRDLVASGASRRSAGLHFPRGATRTVRAMSSYSHHYYASMLAGEPDLPIYRVGMTVIASEGRSHEVRDAYLAEADLRPTSLVPGLPDGLPAGSMAWQGSGCQYADVYELSHSIAKGLRPQVRFLEGVRVLALTSGRDGARLELSTGDAIQAERVVLAPGPWLADPAWGNLVSPLGARVKKVVAMHIQRQPRPDDHVIIFHDQDAFLLPLHHRGHWLFSFTSQEWDVDPDRLDHGLSSRELDEARACLARLAPGLVRHCADGRVFCDAYSPAREPVVRTLDPARRVVFAGACNGSGYRLAPAIAALAINLLQPRNLTRSEA